MPRPKSDLAQHRSRPAGGWKFYIPSAKTASGGEDKINLEKKSAEVYCVPRGPWRFGACTFG
jgi:hypothetical protein